jgi:hypothetical protein
MKSRLAIARIVAFWKTNVKTRTIAALSLGVGILSAGATEYDFSNSNPPGGDGPVNAKAFITFSGNTINITLQNLEANPTGAGQLISGITFDAGGPTSITLTSSSGVLADIGSGVLNGGSAVSLPHWGVTGSGSTFNIALETAGNAAHGGTPVDMIIGPDASGNPNSFNPLNYSAANSSITGNHQPSVLGTATFVLTTSGNVTDISDVQLAFGTGPDFFLTGPHTPPRAPDGGSTIIMLSCAFGGLVRAKTWLSKRQNSKAV